MKLGLCLSGGGIKGAAHIGAIKALEEENIKFDYISGTSSGSIVATLYACGYSTEDMYKLFKKYAKKIKYIDIKNVFKLIYGILVKRKIIVDGLNNGKVIERLINEECNKKNIRNINDIKKPLIIPTVNIKNGSIYIFSSKEIRKDFSDEINYINDIEIGKAVRASCSYPVIFSPCEYNNIKLIDGGIRENVPWKETKKIGADKVLSIVFEKQFNKNCCENIIEIAGRAIDILCYELSTYELNGADYLLKIKSEYVGLLDVKKMDELYYQGYIQTKNKIKEIKKELNK